GLDMFELRELLLLLTQALSDMKSSVLVQLPFELAVIEWGVRHAAGHLAELGEKSAENNGEAEEVVSLAGLRRRTGNLQKIKALYGEVKVEAKKKDTTPTANVSVLDFSAEGEITPEWLSAFWTSIIHDVKQHNHTLAGVMRGCMIKSFDRKKLV